MLGVMNDVAAAMLGSSDFTIDKNYFCRYLGVLIKCSMYSVSIGQIFDTADVDFGVSSYIKQWQFMRIHQALRLPGMTYNIEASETIATDDLDFGKSFRLEKNFKLKYKKYIFYIVR